MKRLVAAIALAFLIPSTAHAYPASWWRALTNSGPDSGIDTGVIPDSGADSGAIDSGPDSGVPIALASPPGVRYGVAGEGQSQFRDDTPLLSNTQKNSHLRAFSATLPALTEPFPGATFESLDTAILHQLTQVQASENDWIYFKRYASGQRCDQINKPNNLYNQVVTQAGQADVSVLALGSEYQLVALVLLIGNTDQIEGTDPAAFLACIRQIRTDLQTDLPGIVHAEGLTMFVSGPASWTTTFSTTLINDAFLSAADLEPARVVVIGPEYFYDYVDTYHLTGQGHRWMGQMIGKVIQAHFFDLAPRGLSWKPNRAKRIVADGSIARLYVDAPCLRYATPRCGANPLARDATIVSARANDGFTYIDEGIGFPPTISSIASAATCPECQYGEWRIDITMTTAVRDGSRFEYAWTPTGNGTVGLACAPGASFSPGCNAAGNWRDTDTTLSEAGSTNLGNWLYHFSMSVTGGVEPSGPPQIANSQGIEFSDNTEYFEVNDTAALQFAQHMTLFFVIRPTTTIVASQHMWTQWTPSTGQRWILRTDGADPDDLIFYVGSTSNFNRCTGCDIPVNATTCVAVVYDGTMPDDQEVTIYTGAAGGSMTAPSQSISGDIPSTLPTSGTPPTRCGYTSADLTAIGDEYAIYGTSLTNEQVSAFCQGYTGSLKVNLLTAGVSGLVGYWPSEINGVNDTTTVTDATGGGKTGTLQSGAAFIAAPGVP